MNILRNSMSKRHALQSSKTDFHPKQKEWDGGARHNEEEGYRSTENGIKESAKSLLRRKWITYCKLSPFIQI